MNKIEFSEIKATMKQLQNFNKGEWLCKLMITFLSLNCMMARHGFRDLVHYCSAHLQKEKVKEVTEFTPTETNSCNV